MDDKNLIWLIAGCVLVYFGYKWLKKRQELGLPIERAFVPPTFQYTDFMTPAEEAIYAAKLTESTDY
ncbi:unnamed protein product [marine sediment metagenome]|uniref:Uncharacterized protein n=1 Tax=marine sediment metagenome TaxID=412755 RepID=X1KUI6_9ZZZZ